MARSRPGTTGLTEASGVTLCHGRRDAPAGRRARAIGAETAMDIFYYGATALGLVLYAALMALALC